MITPSFAPPRLTRLELHGFKSFQTKTVFAFEPGITAVVGPNGSGKSNVADAVRWVLGEQSHGALRSKKTEDVIFAGGQGKAPAGMAEVAVTFDNSTGWLPIEFFEVTVTRRAYRSGENQYLINGKRVRLKDVAHLTASLGQSYTVVGQGLVDAALSQRADERRGLFEHAADLTGLRMKAVEAERSLAETESNSARIADLLTEVEPRVRSLERAARQAREWKGVHDRLRDLQRVHYGRLLEEALARFEETETAAAGDESSVADREAEVDRLVAAIADARIAAEEARATLAQHAAHYQSTVDQTRRAGHERDLAAERHTALTRRREDLLDIQTGLDEQVAGVVSGLATIAEEIKTVEAEVAEVRQAVEGLQTERNASSSARTDLEKRAAKLLATIGEGERKLADLGRRLALLEQRRETDAAERERAETAIKERTARIDQLQAELAGFDTAEQAAATELTNLDGRFTELAEAIEQANATAQTARERVAVCERALGQATNRLDVLQKLQESGAGLFAGVRAVLHAARAGKLDGIRGTVAELIEAPAKYDTAIEVALGGHLQDIVVDRWADAEAAIAFLKKENAGRATFQPLDTVKAGSGRGAQVENGKGAIGVAAELVSAGEDLNIVVSSLLGRTLVVEDLPAARAALKTLPSGWSVVTLAGEIARTGGSVTGGAAVRESGVLSRERELRELPDQIQKLTKERDAAIEIQQAAADEPRRLVEERQGVEATRAGLLASRKERQAQRARVAGWQEDLQREQMGTESRMSLLTAATNRAARDMIGISREQQSEQARLNESRAEHEAILNELNQDAEAAASADRALANEQRRLVALEERLRAERRREAELLAHQATLAEETATRHERLAKLDGERAAVAAQHERLNQELASLTTARERVEAERPPLEAASREADVGVTKFDKALEAAHEALLEAQRSHGTRGVDVERARGELATIRQRIADDLEMEEPDLLLDRPMPEDLEPISPEDAEREIGRLKDRLRRVGYVGENAVEEYEREAERHAFLRTQLDDVEGAAASLRGLLNELHAKMRERFDETFALVSAAFTETFTTLFGGGTARLVLVAGEDDEGQRETGGIDIVAQPPGKRLQSLALLSGGERALTAAALLFAILKVNPTPFCLLDEVDAALDEANVVRFREQLQALASETQAIIITHNRGTIEIADTLYGVSMRDDGVSQVLSLRLTEAIAVAE